MAAPEHTSEPLPLHRLEVPAPETLPFAVGTFDTIGPLARATFPHRHTFYELAYVTEGSGSHVVDLAAWPLRPPQLCVILPGQLHLWQRVSNLRGWVVLFTEDFLLDHPEDANTLRKLVSNPCPPLDERDADDLARLFGDMCAEYDSHGADFVTVLRAYLHVLIVRTGRLPGTPVADPSSGPAALVRDFTSMLDTAGRARLPVRAYARRLGVSVSYLNETVKQVTGTSPGQHIRRAHTLEAKRLLSRTDLTVRQVACEAGFVDPAYFCRFFRRETGMTPGGFREQAGRNHHEHHSGSIENPDMSA